MIHIKAAIQGEPDTESHTIEVHYPESDEVVFFESVKMIKERIAKGLKININETVTMFIAHIVTEFRKGKPADDIGKSLSKVLSPEEVLIGVPESLRQVTFAITLDEKVNENITVHTPIPTSEYVMWA